jgi:hypothetical protein
MSPDGHPDYGNKDVGLSDRHKDHVIAHQDKILKVLDDHDLWQYMNEAGRMAREYTNIRKADPEMVDLVRLVRLSIRGKIPERSHPEYYEVVPQELEWYPLPGRAHYKHSVDNPDWIITQEMKAVLAFFLENTNENLNDPKNPNFDKLRGMTGPERQEYTRESQVRLTRGERDQVIIPPGAGVPFTLFDDPELPRSFPGTRLIRYDHTNPKHNQALRSNRGYARMDAYLDPPEGTEIKPDETRKVMKDGRKKA